MVGLLTTVIWAHSLNIKMVEMLFAAQQIAPLCLTIWRQALLRLATGGRWCTGLGRFISEGHKIWSWRCNPASSGLYKVDQDGNTCRAFIPQDGDNIGRHARYQESQDGMIEEQNTHKCSTREHEDGSISISSSHPFSPSWTSTWNFLQILQNLGNIGYGRI